MRRKRPFPLPKREAVPPRIKAEIILRQGGCCPDCGTRLVLGSIVLDHRPPIALREPGDDLNDPDRLAAICRRCNARKTARDLSVIAKTKRLAHAHQDHLARQSEKVPGRKPPTPAQRRLMDRWIGYFRPERSESDD